MPQSAASDQGLHNLHYIQELLLKMVIQVIQTSDLIIPGLVTNGTAKICYRGLILALFNSTMVIKIGFG